MSYTVIDNEIIRADLKATQKIVLITILSYHNKERGYSYPSHSDLMRDCCIKDKNTLIKAIKDLETLGYLRKETIKGVGNRYYIEEVGEDKTTEKISSVKNPTGGVWKTQLEVCEKPNTINTKTNTKINTNNKKEKEKTNIDKIINAYTENNSLVEAIKDFIKMRKTIKKPITDRGLRGILNKLDQYGDDDLEKIEILENSIVNCWQGVFELKNKKVPSGIGTQNKNNNVNPSICKQVNKYTQETKVRGWGV